MKNMQWLVVLVLALLAVWGIYVARPNEYADVGHIPPVVNFPEIQNKYYRIQDWKLASEAKPYSCVPSTGFPEAPRVTEENIEGNTYCVSSLPSGAAGTTYTDYTYSRVVKGELVIISFVLVSPNCGNYDEPEMSACAEEQANFDVNELVASVFEQLL